MNLLQIKDVLNKYKYVIIAALGIFLVILILLVRLQPQSTPQTDGETPTPTLVNDTFPTVTGVFSDTNRPTQTPLELVKKITYPFTFEKLTMEYKHISKVVLVYYNGDESQAKASYERFLKKYDIPQTLYKAEFFALDTSPLPRENPPLE